jgi:RNA polymerase-binding transcription factor DksA
MSRSTSAAPVVTADSNGAASNHAPGAKKSKSSSGVSKKFLDAQLKALESERATYLRQAESLQAEADSLTEDREPGDVQFDEESGEGDTLAVERERDLALSAAARAAIEQIDVAIGKIKAGTYGQCENCGTTIPEERLEALPHAALCVKCKSGGLGLAR